MTLSHYRFSNVWSVDVAAPAVFDALTDLRTYPSWWPHVRKVHEVDDDTAHVSCRAVLPYSLNLRFRRSEQDESTGRLRVDLTGDLEGYCGAEVRPRGTGTLVVISQEVVLTKAALRRVQPVLRPLFRANHAAMMRRGERGLRAHLAAVSA